MAIMGVPRKVMMSVLVPAMAMALDSPMRMMGTMMGAKLMNALGSLP